MAWRVNAAAAVAAGAAFFFGAHHVSLVRPCHSFTLASHTISVCNICSLCACVKCEWLFGGRGCRSLRTCSHFGSRDQVDEHFRSYYRRRRADARRACKPHTLKHIGATYNHRDKTLTHKPGACALLLSARSTSKRVRACSHPQKIQPTGASRETSAAAADLTTTLVFRMQSGAQHVKDVPTTHKTRVQRIYIFFRQFFSLGFVSCALFFCFACVFRSVGRSVSERFRGSPSARKTSIGETF